MTCDEIDAGIPNDQKLLDKYKKNVEKGRKWKDIAWRALWVFYNGHSYDSLVKKCIRYLFYLVAFVVLWGIFYDIFNDDGNIAFIAVLIFNFIRFIITFILANKVIKDNCKKIADLSEKYTKLKEEYIRERFIDNRIVCDDNNRYECLMNPNLILRTGDGLPIVGEGKPAADFGDITIYPKNNGISYMDSDEKREYKENATQYITSIQFKENFSVYSNNKIRCLDYFSPTMQVDYCENVEVFNRIKRIIISPTEVNFESVVPSDLTGIVKEVSFSPDYYSQTIIEHFDAINKFVFNFSLYARREIEFIFGGKIYGN